MSDLEIPCEKQWFRAKCVLGKDHDFAWMDGRGLKSDPVRDTCLTSGIREKNHDSVRDREFVYMGHH